MYVEAEGKRYPIATKKDVTATKKDVTATRGPRNPPTRGKGSEGGVP